MDSARSSAASGRRSRCQILGETLARYFGVATLVVASLDAYVAPELLHMDLFATACRALQKLLPHGRYGGIDNTFGSLIVGDPELMCL